MSLLEALNAMIPKEASLLGSTPAETAKVVDLAIAYTPVLDESIYNEVDLYQRIPAPVRVQKDGLRYCLMPTGSFRWITLDELKEMRARYLLVHNWYYAHFDRFPHSQQQEIIGKFFKGGMWRPEKGSALSVAMGLE